MKLEEIKLVVQEVHRALQDPLTYPWWLVVMIILMLGVITFISSYLAEKAKGVATKEDINELTRKVEAIKYDYSEKLTRLKGDIDWRNVALEKRLDAHQMAFALLFDLRSDAQSWENHDYKAFRDKYVEFWKNNSIYLAPDARDAFIRAVEGVQSYWTWLKTFQVNPAVAGGSLQATSDELNQKLLAAREAIVEGVALPVGLERASVLSDKQLPA